MDKGAARRQCKRQEDFDFQRFNEQEYAEAVKEKNAVEDITRVLYPNDTTRAGKKLRLKQFLERGIDEGYFRHDVNTDLVMLSFEALGENIQRHSLYKLYTFDELFFNVFMVMLRGISTQQGIEEIDNSMKNIMK